MTRVLVLGSSHVGALRKAAPAFEKAFPTVSISFFAAIAPVFRAGRVSATGHFEPHFRNEDDAELTKRINNGLATCDLGPFDNILCIGHRPAFHAVTRLFRDHDLLEGARTGKTGLISLDFLQAVIKASCDGYVEELKWRFGQAHPFTFTPAPFPSDGIAERMDTYPEAAEILAFMNHPDGKQAFTLWCETFDAQMRAAGYTLLQQPAETLAGPGVTKQVYAKGSLGADGAPADWDDHRHMNTNFGFEMLSAFACDILNIEPAVSAA